MVRSLFLFDIPFWRYLATLSQCSAYLFARRPVMALAPAGHSTDSRMSVPETFIIVQQPVIREIVGGPCDRTELDSLQVQTKWLNVMSKAADAMQLDLGARKG
jgi:hypothetical protein